MPFTKAKSTLLLDLDSTVFIALSESNFTTHGKDDESVKKWAGVHESHVLSPFSFKDGYYFFVINPEKVRTMIESIYADNKEIMIFTSGLWQRNILEIIANLCELAPETKEIFLQSLFFNAQHDSKALDLDLQSTRMMPKGYRLHGLFRTVPPLRQRHFVLLDDSKTHIESCNTLGLGYITGVRASTNTSDCTFYDEVLDKLKAAQESHQEAPHAIPPPSPASATYFYPEEVIKSYLRAISRKEQNTQSTPELAQADDNRCFHYQCMQ